MSRRDSFDSGHGNERHFRMDPQEVQRLIDIGRASSEAAKWERERAQAPTNLNDFAELKMHLINGHQMASHEVDFYDETSHDHIPSLANRARDWSGDTVPALDHKDLMGLHTHEHTNSEYANDYPHSTLGSSHFHH